MDNLSKIFDICGSRIKTAGDIVLHPYFFTNIYDFPILSHIDAERICLLCDYLTMLKTWETKAILLETKDVATYFGVKLQDICDPFRWAICGQQNGPDLFEIAEYLGKEEVLFRLRRSFLPNYYKGIEKDLKLLVDKQRNRSEAHAD